MIDLWLFLMCVMGIILERKEKKLWGKGRMEIWQSLGFNKFWKASIFVNKQKTGCFNSWGGVESYWSFISLWNMFLAKVMGNWGIWRCGLKQLKGERKVMGMKVIEGQW